jgi:hypothetical protein
LQAFAFGLIATIPTQKDAAMGQTSSLDASITLTINVYSN